MNELRLALAQAKTGLAGVALFTGVVNILMLTGPCSCCRFMTGCWPAIRRPRFLCCS